tara:strand:- start:2561 stop:3118 length:558 start_codon:yes stop_codon:yes gene_type:complete
MKPKYKGILSRLDLNIRFLNQRHGVSKSGEIIGINYLLATIYIMRDMTGDTIFSDRDYFKHTTNGDSSHPNDFDGNEGDHEVGYVGKIGLSRKFLSRRIKKFNSLLNDFNNPKEQLNHSEIISRRRKDLEYSLMEFKNDGKIDWLNRNGFYSFFKGVVEGYVTYGELGEMVKRTIKYQEKLINSK